MRQKIELFLVTTLVSLLVWLYAESVNVTPDTVTSTLSFTAAAGGTPLDIQPASRSEIKIMFNCANQRLQAARDLLNRPVELQLTFDPKNPSRTVILQDLLAAHPKLKALGVTVLDVQPATVDVAMERIETRSLPVTVVSGDIELAGPPTVTPDTVEIHLPESAAEQLAEDAQIEVRLNALDLSEYEPNVPITLDAPVSPPLFVSADKVQLIPRSVTVTFTMRKVSDKLTLQIVPIVVSMPPSRTVEYVIELDEEHRVLRDVVLSGPTDALRRIEQDASRIYASFRLTSLELESGDVTTAPLELHLPPGVTVDTPPAPVQFKIVRRAEQR